MRNALKLLVLILVAVSNAAGSDAVACSHDDRAFLTFFVGDWRAVTTTRAPDGGYADGLSEAEFERALAGCGVIGREQIRTGALASSAVVVITASEDGAFELARADSEHGAFTVSTGRLVQGVLELNWSRDLGERVLSTRTVYRFTEDGTLHVERLLSRADGSEWELTFRGRYERMR